MTRTKVLLYWLIGLASFAMTLALHTPLILTAVPGGMLDHQAAGTAAEVDRIQAAWRSGGCFKRSSGRDDFRPHFHCDLWHRVTDCRALSEANGCCRFADAGFACQRCGCGIPADRSHRNNRAADPTHELSRDGRSCEPRRDRPAGQNSGVDRDIHRRDCRAAVGLQSIAAECLIKHRCRFKPVSIEQEFITRGHSHETRFRRSCSARRSSRHTGLCRHHAEAEMVL